VLHSFTFFFPVSCFFFLFLRSFRASLQSEKWKETVSDDVGDGEEGEEATSFGERPTLVSPQDDELRETPLDHDIALDDSQREHRTIGISEEEEFKIHVNDDEYSGKRISAVEKGPENAREVRGEGREGESSNDDDGQGDQDDYEDDFEDYDDDFEDFEAEDEDQDQKSKSQNAQRDDIGYDDEKKRIQYLSSKSTCVCYSDTLHGNFMCFRTTNPSQ
jgi:hypothetical protein